MNDASLINAIARRTTGTAFFHKQSAHRYTERGVELDGQVVREYPAPRRFELPVVGSNFETGAA